MKAILAGMMASVGVLLNGIPGESALPDYDHVVVVIEENKSFQQVINSGAAPYLDSLAAGGVSFQQMYGMTHPSQPNYLNFFSGSNQGIIDNNDAPGVPFSTPNLGAAVLQTGRTFVGYSETMPAAGFTGHDAAGGLYARRHNPWVNWQANSPSTNQLAPSVNQPFAAFPSDYSQLPDLSVVVPNNANNMHDGTITAGDTWLKQNLGNYATWAQDHNSLLIVTFDEDNSASRNRIPTVFYGAHVNAGVKLNTTWTMHNLLRTLTELQGADAPGAAREVRPMVGAFDSDPMVETRVFRQGANGYAGAHDTFLDSANGAVSHGGDNQITSDGQPATQALIRFDDLFGGGSSQVPVGATILSAKLSLLTTDLASNAINLHELLMPWNESSTWNSLQGGVSLDGTEASAGQEFSLLPNISGDYAIFDVTDTVQAFAFGKTNYGWALQAAGGDAWKGRSSEASTVGDRPTLEITYLIPEPTFGWPGAATLTTLFLGQGSRQRKSR